MKLWARYCAWYAKPWTSNPRVNLAITIGGLVVFVVCMAFKVALTGRL